MNNELARRLKRAEHARQARRKFLILSSTVLVLVIIAGTAAVAAYDESFFNSVPTVALQPVVVASTTPSAAPDAYAHVSIIGKAAIVYDLTTGQTLYAQNAYAQLPLASITKLLTLYAAANILTPTSSVTMTPLALSQDGDAADNGFKVGETFEFEDIARLTLAASSNDGAEAIAEAADAAKETQTTSLLASATAALNLKQTYAVNSSGLDVSATQSGGYGSAHDVAVLAGSLLQKDPSIAAATTLPSITVTSEQGITHSFANTDIDVTHYPGLLLSKTGYTDLAGGNLVIIYDAAIDHPVAIVVLGSTEEGRFTDVSQLMQATLAHFGGTVPA